MGNDRAGAHLPRDRSPGQPVRRGAPRSRRTTATSKAATSATSVKGPYPGTYPETKKKDWGDIIPPFDYVDENNKPAVSEGVNWTPEGQAIYENGCNPVTLDPGRPDRADPRVRGGPGHWRIPRPLRLQQPERRDHHPDPARQSEPLLAAERQRPAADIVRPRALHRCLPGRVHRGDHVVADRERAEGLARTRNRAQGGRSRSTSGSSRPRTPGRFALLINGEVKGGAAAVGDGGTTGTIAVSTGRHTVTERGAPGTSLADYTTGISCRTDRCRRRGRGARRPRSQSAEARRSSAPSPTLPGALAQAGPSPSSSASCSTTASRTSPSGATTTRACNPAVVPVGGTSGISAELLHTGILRSGTVSPECSSPGATSGSSRRRSGRPGNSSGT